MDAGRVVDLHGRAVAATPVKGGALLRAQEWLAWLDEWTPKLSETEPWVRLLVASTINLHQAFPVWARRLRKKAHWAGVGTMAEDTRSLTHDAEDRLAAFERGKSQIFLASVPVWARFLFDAIEGALRMLVRVAREADQILAHGHLVIPVDRHGDVPTSDEIAGERE